ncbi:MAG: 4-hydroxy-3-methylbut-2-en-yl diphosphate synthase [Bacteroidota bacterium]
MKDSLLAPILPWNPTSYQRLLTREVHIGDVPLGGNNPIRVQSMTTTDTMDTMATVEQSIRMIEAGCEYVRITAPSINEARNLEEIKKELRKRGYKTPLVADIHFTPNAAELAARIVEKVRVNPGNYADKKKFETIDYSDASYESELERIRERFTPLVRICKEYGTAMRIGTNHGSLSDRIMSRYGDSPLGMVESALEFLRICREESFHNIVLSMKSSNPQVMVQAYRLLIQKMHAEGMDYPLHLGVTEAGEGEDGRIKSAAGIGTLLEDGIGDTIRVSLTEDPEFEIPVARELVSRYNNRIANPPIPDFPSSSTYNPYDYSRRMTGNIMNIGGDRVPVVISDLSRRNEITQASLYPTGYSYSVPLDKWNLSDQASDYVYAGDLNVDFDIPGTLGIIYNSETWKTQKDRPRSYPLFCGWEYLNSSFKSDELNFVAVDASVIFSEQDFLAAISDDTKVVLVLDTINPHGMAEQRRIFVELMSRGISLPVIIKRNYKTDSDETLQLHASTDIGALLLDGMGDGVWIKAPNVSEMKTNTASFGILQATRCRISKTEYISCPSCGRTLFDLQETTAKIRSRTDHLKGLKIGIMGCIVNGPGEMADADYGYVGVGVGKITLYKGKEVVKRNIESDVAVDELIDLIKQHGDWVEPEPMNSI